MAKLKTFLDLLEVIKHTSKFNQARTNSYTFAINLFREVKDDKQLSELLYPVTSIGFVKSWQDFDTWCAKAETLLKQALDQK